MIFDDPQALAVVARRFSVSQLETPVAWLSGERFCVSSSWRSSPIGLVDSGEVARTVVLGPAYDWLFV